MDAKPSWKSKLLLPCPSLLAKVFRQKSKRNSRRVPGHFPYWNDPLVQLYDLELVQTSGRREVRCQASANLSSLQQPRGGRDLQLGRPDVAALAGNEVHAPPQSPRGRTPGSKPHPIPLATRGPDRLFTDSAPAVVSQEMGKAHQLLAHAPGPFSTRDGRLWWLLFLSALDFSRELWAVCPRERNRSNFG